jgi:hypothetical protein
MKPTCLLEEFPDVWAEKGPPSLARNNEPIMIDLKPGALPVRQRQYPVPQEAYLGIQAHLQQMKDAGILIECQLPWNTPLLSIKKAGRNNYQPVQNLQAVNNTIITLHPVFPNPYTLLSLLPPQASWFTCLDLKDTVFCLAWPQLASFYSPLNGKTPPYWKKDINDLDQAASRIQKLTHFVQGSPSSRFINFPRSKPTLYLAPIHG